MVGLEYRREYDKIREKNDREIRALNDKNDYLMHQIEKEEFLIAEEYEVLALSKNLDILLNIDKRQMLVDAYYGEIHNNDRRIKELIKQNAFLTAMKIVSEEEKRGV